MLTQTRLRYAAMTAVFLLAMLGVKQIVTFSVAAGIIPWLALMGAIFWLGIFLENRARLADGREPYSWGEARELAKPLGGLAIVIALAYCWRWV